jgi:hypothetical protein
MLFYLFLSFQVLYSVSCVIKCHNCPLSANTFNYHISTDRLPDELSNCDVQEISDTCIIDVIWGRNPDKTDINLAPRGDGKSELSEHELNTNIELAYNGSQYEWSQSISYMCSTDQCNSLTELKRILSSLTLNDKFQDLEDLLKMEEPFDDSWCLFFANTTTLECATTTIPPATCKECSFEGFTNNGAWEICANCLTYDIGNTFLSHEVDFNMTGRTRADHWIMECQSKDCNTPNNGNRIRQKSTSNFDFVKFLDGRNKSTTLSLISKFTLLFVVFIVKFLN